MHSPDSSSASRPADELLAGTVGGDEAIDYSLSTSEICRQMFEKQLKKLHVLPDSSTPSPPAFEFADGQNRRITATARRAIAKPSKRVVCVQNLPHDCLEADLIKTLQHAEYFGNISYVAISEERSGVGYVEFASGDLADKCLRQSQGRDRVIKVKGQAIQIVCQTKFNTELPRRTGAESAAPTKILYLQIIAISPEQKITVRDILAICGEAELSNVLRIAIEPDQTSLIVEAFVEFPDRDAATKAKFALNGQDLFSAASALQPDKNVIGTINVAEFANMLVVEFPEAANLDDHYDAEETISLDPSANCLVVGVATVKQEEEDVQFLYECPGRKEESPPDTEHFPSEGAAKAASDEALPAAVVMATNHSAPPPQSIEAAAISIVTVQAVLPAASLSAPLPSIEVATTTISTDQATQNDQFAAIEPMASGNEESLVAVESAKSALPISALDLEQSSANADCFALAIETEATVECASVDTSFGRDPELSSQTKQGITMPTECNTAAPAEDAGLVTVANSAFGASCGNDECADEDALSVAANRGTATPTPTAAFLSPLRNTSASANKIASGDLPRAIISLVPDYGDSPVASRVSTPAPATPLPELESIPLPPSEPATDCAEKRSDQSETTSDDNRITLPPAKRAKSKRANAADLFRSESKQTNGTVVPSAYDPWPFTPLPPVYYSSIIQHGPEPAPGFGLHKPRAVLKVYGVDMRVANCDHIFNLFSLYGNVVKVKCLRPTARYSTLMSALVQMGDNIAAQRAKEHLDGVVLFGRQLAISHFKDDFIEPPDPFGVLHTLPSDRSPVFKDYSESSWNRFTSAMAFKRVRISYPKNALVFYGPPRMTEEPLRRMLHEYGAPRPTAIEIWSSNNPHESHGRISFSGPGPAVDAVALANNAQIQAFVTDGFTYSLQLAFLGGLQFEANGSLTPQAKLPPPWSIRAPAAIVDAPTANVSNGGGSADQAFSGGVTDMDIE